MVTTRGTLRDLLCAALTPCSPLQLTVYLGKRDFVDHIDVVDPVGM